MNLQSILSEYNFHQNWEVEDGIFTGGVNDVNRILSGCNFPNDLSGKRILDIGSFNGCFSFECERRGSSDVIAIGTQCPNMTGFNSLKKYLNSNVKYIQKSVYHVSPSDLGTFDIILFLGVIYHLRYPLLALDRIYDLCSEIMFLESHVIDNNYYLRKKTTITQDLDCTPLLRFFDAFELNPKDSTSWFSPNILCLIELLKSSGFEANLENRWNDRAIFKCNVKNRPERLSCNDMNYPIGF
jgi:tRNA (mo5U34)-methyltransferase